MAFFSKQQPEPIPEVETSVWSCTNDGCSGWMRENFSFEATPACPLCASTMQPEVRMLPEIS
ncbi:cold-shock protein [Pseudalkalibacillus caeni]|uniref:Cold-shock protein n=1 Tax=Exobacillus caeni TaxID=2574798 RepID=A0A5R9F4Z5_9BACL|nr:cold-shock protein [Pseudalkalibacillus caeni]TLS37416.1 cold-shock protein [Pseudalkalibacillus caeni]